MTDVRRAVPDAVRMNLLDVLILAFVVSAVTFGFHRGLWLTAFEYAGLVLGVVAGALVAPIAISRLGVEHILLRILVVLIVVGAAALVGSTIAHELGAPIRRASRRVHTIAVVDGVAARC